MRKAGVFGAIFWFCLIGVAVGKPITFADLYGFDRPGDLHLSPDGGTLAFTVTHNNLEEHSRTTFIYLYSLADGSNRRLTENDSGESTPRWLPAGGSLSFISRGENGPAVWLAEPLTEKQHPLKNMPAGVGSVTWFPDGRRFLYVSTVEKPGSQGSHSERDSLARETGVKARLYDHLMFRHYSSWDDGKIRHLFLGDTASTEALDLTPGEFSVPPLAGGGYPAFAIAPAGDEICYAKNTDAVLATSYNNNLYIVSPAGGEARQLTTDPGNEGGPQYSPDGQYLVYRQMKRPGYESEQRDLILYDRQAQTSVNLTGDFDRSVGQMVFSPDGKYIYFTAVDLGFVAVYRVKISEGKVEEILADAVYSNLNISPDGRQLYFIRATSTQPGEIYSYHLKKKELQRLTFFTRELTDRVTMQPAEEFWFYSVDSLPIQGFLTYPPAFTPEKKYPLVLLIHGGPQWCWLNEFNFYGWNTQLLAAQGYVIAQINPRGSRGYGVEFCDAVSGDWGGKDYQDLMLGIDYLADRFAFLDTTRMAALGRSYGGFMTNWICGRTNRFKCLVTIDGLFDHISDYYSTEELWFPEWEFGGPPWANRELYDQRSPERYVENFQTPTLVVHGQKDYRVDVSQGLMMFTALQRRGVPSKLLYFPDEGHAVRKLHNLRYVYQVQLDWLAEYLK